MKPIIQLWLDGWSLRNIALKHNVSVEHVESVIRETWGKL